MQRDGDVKIEARARERERFGRRNGNSLTTAAVAEGSSTTKGREKEVRKGAMREAPLSRLSKRRAVCATHALRRRRGPRKRKRGDVIQGRRKRGRARRKALGRPSPETQGRGDESKGPRSSDSPFPPRGIPRAVEGVQGVSCGPRESDEDNSSALSQEGTNVRRDAEIGDAPTEGATPRSGRPLC